jgi:hypothetical protein
MSHPPPSKVGPLAAIGGALLLFIGTWMHPMDADPNIPIAAFTEYAADHHWVASHLTELFGVLLMSAALILLLRRLFDGPGADWAVLATAGVIAGLAAAAALQAVDGVALKVMVDAWAAAPASAKLIFLQTAFAVRQIEIGLASVTSLLFRTCCCHLRQGAMARCALPPMVRCARFRWRDSNRNRRHHDRLYRILQSRDGNQFACGVAADPADASDRHLWLAPFDILGFD